MRGLHIPHIEKKSLYFSELIWKKKTPGQIVFSQFFLFQIDSGGKGFFFTRDANQTSDVVFQIEIRINMRVLLHTLKNISHVRPALGSKGCIIYIYIFLS